MALEEIRGRYAVVSIVGTDFRVVTRPASYEVSHAAIAKLRAAAALKVGRLQEEFAVIDVDQFVDDIVDRCELALALKIVVMPESPAPSP